MTRDQMLRYARYMTDRDADERKEEPEMELERVAADLSSKQKEIFNFQKTRLPLWVQLHQAG